MLLKITYLGYSCFLVESHDGVKVITDPYNENSGFSLPAAITADMVLVSHTHPNHSCIESVTGNPGIIQSPGYRELGWVKIKGLKSYHDRLQGEKHGPNTIFCWDMRAVRLCHLGDLGCIPDKNTLEQIGVVDILFVPIGGKAVLTPEDALKVCQLIKCKLIVPMHYRTAFNDHDFDYTLNDFKKYFKNVLNPEPKNEFTIQRQTLANIQEKQLLPLEYLEKPGSML